MTGIEKEPNGFQQSPYTLQTRRITRAKARVTGHCLPYRYAAVSAYIYGRKLGVMFVGAVTLHLCVCADDCVRTCAGCASLVRPTLRRHCCYVSAVRSRRYTNQLGRCAFTKYQYK